MPSCPLLAEKRERRTRDLYQVKCIKGEEVEFWWIKLKSSIGGKMPISSSMRRVTTTS